MAKQTGVERAIKKLRGDAKVATVFGITRQSVRHWRELGYAPWERAAKLSALSGVPVIDLVDPKLRELLA